ncbi:MAG TPA: recombinase family protein [Ktedonobacteraceae bacterium]|nr:recombinase family protein [Ktedonobacteraceae bacterium]
MTTSRDIAAGEQFHERPFLRQMRQCIRDGEIQRVVVTTLDRLSRNQAHLITLMEEMDQYNVELDGASVENAE